jgi:hypothetical protein
MAISRQRIGKHIPAATNMHATMKLLLDTVFSTRSVQGSYKEDKWGDRVEAGSNTFTVTLRVVGGDENGNLKF